jgi:phosphatidylglycerol---prolipoprotein diacylglyceryl transferase
MHPILFEVGGITVYSYGFMIALGAIAGVTYMVIQGKKEVGLSFDQGNTLFLLIFAAAFIGGKVFLLFEEPSLYIDQPKRLLAGRGFVFYGSFLFAVPTMIWFFRKHKIHMQKMLDVMAITTCMVHMFGRLGCYMAGCCYGKPTDSVLGVIFTDPACMANPKGVPLHPTQLYEAALILLVMIGLFLLRDRRKFYGQLFLTYLLCYALGRFVLEYFRGDEQRGFIIDNLLSHSQFIALIVFAIVCYVYLRWAKVHQLKPRKAATSPGK